MKNIEEYVFEDSLPVNTLPMIERLKEILKTANTNSVLSLREKEKDGYKEKELFDRFKACLWLINQQVYGQLNKIDLYEEWNRLEKEAKNWS